MEERSHDSTGVYTPPQNVGATQHIKLSFNSAAPNADWSPGSPGEPFTVHFPQAIVLAPSKTYGVRVISANYVYSFPNVSSENNQFVYERSGVQYTLTIPDGLYTFSDLADDLADQMTGNGHGAHASPVLGLVGNPATGILAVQINDGFTGYRVRWDLCTIGDDGLPHGHGPPARKLEQSAG
jgi:hypothetical protein